ncbi:RNA-binding RNA annealing protein [Naganishia albida]|nr:RNA-binding RNA annealing protein [Naganishia albida]
MDIDKGLDELITSRKAANKNTKRGGGAGGRRGGAAAAAAPGGARARYAGAVPATRGAQQQAAVAPLNQATKDSLKIIISNLPMDVDEAAVRELFHKTCGPVKSCSLAYDSKGKSKGVADVVFVRRGDAQKAFDQYNNRMIDQS